MIYSKSVAFWLVETHTANGYLANIVRCGTKYIVRLWDVKINDKSSNTNHYSNKNAEGGVV